MKHKAWCVYHVRLANNKHFVAHGRSGCSIPPTAWTEQHKPISAAAVVESHGTERAAQHYASVCTERLMREYGSVNVRGGVYQLACLSAAQVSALKKRSRKRARSL